MPVEFSDDETVSAYNKWLDQRLIAPLRLRAPERYRAVVGYLQSLIESVADTGDEKKVE